MLEVQILRGPHLMLSHARRYDGFSLNNLVQTLQHVLRLDRFRIAIVVMRVLLSHGVHVLLPCREILLEARTRIDQIRERGLRISRVRPGRCLDLAVFRRIDIDMRNKTRLRRELFGNSRNAIAHAFTTMALNEGMTSPSFEASLITARASTAFPMSISIER